MSGEVWQERTRMEDAFARAHPCPFCDAVPGAPCRRVPQSPAARDRGERGEAIDAHAVRMTEAKKASPEGFRALQKGIAAMIQQRIDQIEAAHAGRPETAGDPGTTKDRR